MNPFMQPMAWQCGCLVRSCSLDACHGLDEDGCCPCGYATSCGSTAIRKTQSGTKTLCGFCGMRRPTS